LIIFAIARSPEVSVAGSLPSTSAAVARMDVLAALERLAQLRLARDVREDPQLDLRVVRREETVTRLGHERGADLAPELRRIGIACRFGLDVDRRPVAATCWLMVVWSRPSSPMSVGSGPRYVFTSFVSSRHSSITGTISWSPRIARSTLPSVE
jgi:hypothetical protein